MQIAIETEHLKSMKKEAVALFAKKLLTQMEDARKARCTCGKEVLLAVESFPHDVQCPAFTWSIAKKYVELACEDFSKEI